MVGEGAKMKSFPGARGLPSNELFSSPINILCSLSTFGAVGFRFGGARHPGLPTAAQGLVGSAHAIGEGHGHLIAPWTRQRRWGAGWGGATQSQGSAALLYVFLIYFLFLVVAPLVRGVGTSLRGAPVASRCPIADPTSDWYPPWSSHMFALSCSEGSRRDQHVC